MDGASKEESGGGYNCDGAQGRADVARTCTVPSSRALGPPVLASGRLRLHVYTYRIDGSNCS